MNKPDFGRLMGEIETLLNRKASRDDILKELCRLLRKKICYYNWVGFYMADDQKKELRLGVFDGEDTEHKRIRYGQGICGQAAASRETFLVNDVSKEKNYLSCSPLVKSEIVVPIFKYGKFLAEIDIDSHYINAFDEKDRDFLEKIAKKVAEIL